MASPFEISKSSLVNLKAELYRKQEEYRRKRLAHASAVPNGYQALPGKHIVRKDDPEKKKNSANSSKNSNPGIQERTAKDVKDLSEPGQEKSWEQVREALERKAKLYDKLSSQQYDPDADEGPLLVDFSRKSVSSRVEPVNNFEDSSDDEIGPVPPPRNSDEEWTEYVDYLGRSRKCLRRDLPQMLTENDRLQRDTETARMQTGNNNRASETDSQLQGFDFGPAPLSERTLLSNDMRREKERQSWVTKTTDLHLADDRGDERVTYNPRPAGPLSYETVRDNEIRELGIGYYKFSTDPATKDEELNRLQKLREQTLEQRIHSTELKAKRKALADARLAKIREKKNIKSVPVDEKDEDIEEFEKLLTPAPALHTKSKAELDAERVGHAPVRPWDLGKVGPDASEDLDRKYVAKRREDRIADFAPPEMYHEREAKRPFRKGAAWSSSTPATELTNIPHTGYTWNAAVPSSSKPAHEVSHVFGRTSERPEPPAKTAKTDYSWNPVGPSSSRPTPEESHLSGRAPEPMANIPITGSLRNAAEPPRSMPSHAESHVSGGTPEPSDYKPWEHIQPWQKAHGETGSGKQPQKLSSAPWASVPPPGFYEDTASSRPMSFHHVNAAEIREQAKMLFRNKTGQDMQ